MPLLLLIWNNKRWTLILVLLIYAVFQTWQSNSLAGDLNKANAECKTKVQQEVDVAVAGLLVSFMSFLINWYYKRQENKRADQLHQIALRKANGECNVEQN